MMHSATVHLRIENACLSLQTHTHTAVTMAGHACRLAPEKSASMHIGKGHTNFRIISQDTRGTRQMIHLLEIPTISRIPMHAICKILCCGDQMKCTEIRHRLFSNRTKN